MTALVLAACSTSERQSAPTTSSSASATTDAASPQPLSFDVDGLSTEFDLHIDAESCQVVERECDGPATVTLTGKGAREAFQTIAMPHMYIAPGDDGQPEIEYDGLYGNHVPVLVLSDLNFDGRPDLGLRNGNGGNYQGPSYNIYLARPDGPAFEYSQPFTDIASHGLDFPFVDLAEQRIHVLTKDGCCVHYDTSYAVRGGVPVEVRTKTDYADATLGVEWAPAQRGWGSPHPSRVDNGGDPTGIAFDLEWDSWGDPQAVAHGMTYIVPEGEGHGAADAVPGPITVVAYDLGDCHGQLAYRSYQWLIRDEQFDPDAGSDYDICPPEGPYDPDMAISP